MTSEQHQQMRRIFPTGWEQSDIPPAWREKEEREDDEDTSPEYREE